MPGRSLETLARRFDLRRISLRVFFGLSLAAQIAFAGGIDPQRRIERNASESWTVNEGLPHSTVRAMAVDRDGAIWLGTYDGLVRFNGYDLAEVSLKAVQVPSILSLVFDGDGTLWIGTNGGLEGLKDGRSTGRVLDSSIHALAAGSEGELWIGTNGEGLFRRHHGDIDHWGRDEGLADLAVTALLIEGDTVWVGTNSGLARLRGDELEPIQELSGRRIGALLRRGDRLWVGTDRGVEIFDQRQRILESLLVGRQITSLLGDGDSVWIGTYDGGLQRFHGGRIEGFSTDDGLLEHSVRSLVVDSVGGLWIGTNGGVQRLETEAFVALGSRDGLPDPYVRAVLEDPSGRLWVATAGGLVRYDSGGRQVFDRSTGLADDYVFSLATGSAGGMWIGTSAGLNLMDEAGGLERWNVRDGLPSDNVRAIVEHEQNLWIGTDRGLSRMEISSGELELIEAAGSAYVMGLELVGDVIWVATDGDGLFRVEGEELEVWAEDHDLPSSHFLTLSGGVDGAIWAGSDGAGLVRIHDRSVAVLGIAQGLGFAKVTQILDDGEGALWVGSNRGLERLDLAQVDALFAGEIDAITPDHFGSADGLPSVHLNGASQPASWKGADGRLYFATAGGLAELGPQWRQHQPVSRDLQTVIEGVWVDGRRTEIDEPIQLKATQRRLEIEFAAVALDAPHRVRYRCRMVGYDGGWLELGDQRRVGYTNLPPGEDRFEVSASLDGERWGPPSTLRVQFKAQLWETKEFRLAMVGLVGLLVLISHRLRVDGLSKRNLELDRLVKARTAELVDRSEHLERSLDETSQARREAEALRSSAAEAQLIAEQASRAKSVFLAATSHELRSPLTSMIGFSQILLEREMLESKPRHFVENIHISACYLLGLINNLLDLSKIEAGRMDLRKELVDLQEVFDRSAEILAGIAAPKGITFECRIEDPARKAVLDQDKMHQVFANLLTNAVKFSPADSTVEVRARLLDNDLEIIFRDHGIGIASSDHERIFLAFDQGSATTGQSGTGLGLNLVKRFVEMHDGSISVESALGQGSTFRILLPI